MRFLCLYFLLPANSDHSNLYWKHIFIRWWEEIYLRLADEKKCFSLFKAYDQVWQRNSLATGLQKILARRECCLLSAPDRTRNTATYIETTGAKWRRLPGDVGQESDFATRDGIYNRGLWGTIQRFFLLLSFVNVPLWVLSIAAAEQRTDSDGVDFGALSRSCRKCQVRDGLVNVQQATRIELSQRKRRQPPVPRSESFAVSKTLGVATCSPVAFQVWPNKMGNTARELRLQHIKLI